jgi:hypothetical protein
MFTVFKCVDDFSYMRLTRGVDCIGALRGAGLVMCRTRVYVYILRIKYLDQPISPDAFMKQIVICWSDFVSDILE